jgi:SNF2 family DNA or RNA helicase
MPLDVQRTIFAAQQAEGARKQAYQRDKEAQEGASLARTQTQLNQILGEQRKFFEDEFKRLSEMAQTKGAQDVTRGVKSEVADPRMAEYYDLGRGGQEASGIQAQQAEESKRLFRQMETDEKGREAQLTGLWDKNIGQGEQASAKAETERLGHLTQVDRQYAQYVESMFRAGQIPMSRERFLQELLLRQHGASRISAGNTYNTGTLSAHSAEIRHKIGQIHSRRRELESMIDPITGKIREHLDPASLPAIRAELEKLRRDEMRLNAGWELLSQDFGRVGRDASRFPEEEGGGPVRKVMDAAEDAALQRAIKKHQPK